MTRSGLAERDNLDFNIYYETAKTMLGQKGSKEAIICSKKALMKAPKSAKAHNNLGVAFLFLGEKENAIKEFEESIGLDPKEPNAYLNLAGILLTQKKTNDAIERIKIVIALNGTAQPDAYLLWGQCLVMQHDVKGANDKFGKAIELDPTFGPAYFHWGLLLKNSNDCKKAIEMFNNSTKYEHESQVRFIRHVGSMSGKYEKISGCNQ